MGTSEKDTLHVLAIFHYIISAFIAVVSFIPIIYLVLGVSIIADSAVSNDSESGVVGLGFAGFAGVVLLLFWGIAILIFMAGKNLDRQTNWVLCMTAAVVMCLFTPLGTILGIFTIITLNDDKVKSLFHSNSTEANRELY